MCLCGIYLTCKAYRAIKLITKWKASWSKLRQSTVRLYLFLLVIIDCNFFRRPSAMEVFLPMNNYMMQAPCALFVMMATESPRSSHANTYSARIAWRCGWIGKEHVRCVVRRSPRIPNGKTAVPHILSSFSELLARPMPWHRCLLLYIKLVLTHVTLIYCCDGIIQVSFCIHVKKKSCRCIRFFCLSSSYGNRFYRHLFFSFFFQKIFFLTLFSSIAVEFEIAWNVKRKSFV